MTIRMMPGRVRSFNVFRYLEILHQPQQFLSLVGHLLARSGGLLNQRSVLLCHGIHLGYGDIYLVDALLLFHACRPDLGDDA